MFFREKTSKMSNTPTLQLVENKRVVDKVKQIIVISLGTGFDVPPDLRVEVAKAIKVKLAGQEVLTFNPAVADLAERIVKKIHSTELWKSRGRKTGPPPLSEPVPAVAEVLIDEVEHGEARSLGSLLIGHHFWQRLGFDEVLAGCGFNGVQQRVAEILVLHRLIEPGSESSIPGWIARTAVADLVDRNAEQFGEDRFYRISDRLLGQQASIERGLYTRVQSLFGLDGAICLYDLTNTYFEGMCLSNPQAERNGNQKEKRGDCPQVVVALALDNEGFVRRHWTFRGKMSDSKSLPLILKTLHQDAAAGQMPTVIMDRGVATDDNVNLLKSNGFHYIAVGRAGDEAGFMDEFAGAEFKSLQTASGQAVEVRLEQRSDETFLLCKSEGRLAKETAMRNQAELRLEADLSKLKASIDSGRRKDPVEVERAIGRIRERHSRAAHYFEITFKPLSFVYTVPADAPKRLATSLRKLQEKAAAYVIGHAAIQKNLNELQDKHNAVWDRVKIDLTPPELTWRPYDEQRADRARLDGCYMLRTDRTDMKDAELWCQYMMLTWLEAAFRHLKSDLGLRPNYHQLERRVNGHIFISILAYHLLHAIETTLRQHDDNHSWPTINRVVSNHTYATVTLPTAQQKVIHVRKPGRPEPIHIDIYNKLGIAHDKLPTLKLMYKM